MKAFVDTNVPVAYSFELNSLNKKSKKVFNNYIHLYWSTTVKNEYEIVFDKKLYEIRKFFKNFYEYLENCYYFYEEHIDEYINSLNKTNTKDLRNTKRILEIFWGTYIKYPQPHIEEVKIAIEKIFTFLEIKPYKNRSQWEQKIIKTPKRTESYTKILKKLHKFKVHYPDDEILLDAYDYNINYCEELDFITFDSLCYKAASEIKDFSFNKVKGTNDFW